MRNKLDKIFCLPDVRLKEALRRLDEGSLQILLVVDENNKLMGTVTDGDIRRAILKNVPLSVPISKLMNENPIVLPKAEISQAQEFIKRYGVKQLPVIDEGGRVIDLILWKDFFQKTIKPREKDNYVFIPAGGKGTRLEPFTKILPKSLIPIGNKPVLENILDRFMQYGFYKFIIALNYKGDMIKSYFSEIPHKYCIEYVKEEIELGTAGCLAALKGKAKDSVIVSNCDIITNIDFDDFLAYHKRKQFQATIVGAIRHVKIPYGILEIKNSYFSGIIEKPEYDFIINSGIYAIEPEILNLISDNSYLDMPDLLKMIKDHGLKVGVYPFNGEWFDIGQWEEYKNAMNYLKIYGDI